MRVEQPRDRRCRQQRRRATAEVDARQRAGVAGLAVGAQGELARGARRRAGRRAPSGRGPPRRRRRRSRSTGRPRRRTGSGRTGPRAAPRRPRRSSGRADRTEPSPSIVPADVRRAAARRDDVELRLRAACPGSGSGSRMSDREEQREARDRVAHECAPAMPPVRSTTRPLARPMTSATAVSSTPRPVGAGAHGARVDERRPRRRPPSRAGPARAAGRAITPRKRNSS